MAEEDSFNIASLLKFLIQCSEKASHIAQICRSDNELFSLLIQEKKHGEKNMRFFQDFKTLADVLVQETIRWEITKKFPSLRSNIFGEENTHFENTLGESIDVCINDCETDTRNLLYTVLDEREDSANLLAAAIYENVDVDVQLPQDTSNVFGQNVGIWIDPIDSTCEYVHASKDVDEDLHFALNGLKCVSVLIGAYDMNTGLPIMGVVNQPFFKKSANGYASRYFWAICHGDTFQTSVIPRPIQLSKAGIVISGFENKKLLSILKAKYTIHKVAGAGYKSLLVACGNVDMYVLSVPTLSFWDTCAPHSLLSALGGGIVDFQRTVSSSNVTPDDLTSLQLRYHKNRITADSKPYCNSGGIIAYRHSDFLMDFLQYLSETKCELN